MYVGKRIVFDEQIYSLRFMCTHETLKMRISGQCRMNLILMVLMTREETNNFMLYSRIKLFNLTRINSLQKLFMVRIFQTMEAKILVHSNSTWKKIMTLEENKIKIIRNFFCLSKDDVKCKQ